MAANCEQIRRDEQQNNNEDKNWTRLLAESLSNKKEIVLLTWKWNLCEKCEKDVALGTYTAIFEKDTKRGWKREQWALYSLNVWGRESTVYSTVRYTRESLPLHPPIRRIFSFNLNK